MNFLEAMAFHFFDEIARIMDLLQLCHLLQIIQILLEEGSRVLFAAAVNYAPQFDEVDLVR